MQSANQNFPVISFARIPCSICLSALQEDLHRLLQGAWVDHVNRRDYQGGWDVLPLRCERQHQAAHPILQGFAIQDGEDWINLSALNQSPAILQCVEFLQCPVKAVRLMRLKAGSHIRPHRDQELSLEYGEARLHLPILTGEHILFRVNGLTVPMSAGELWYINADQEHEVVNSGDQDRINLVIDCGANAWLKNLVGVAP